MLLLAIILLSIATLGYSAIAAKFDSNETHATNPSWDPHARFHVVWQVSSYVYVAALAIGLIWTAGDDHWPLWIAAILATAAYGGFWTAALSRSVYGGAVVSKINPVPAFTWNLGGRQVETDANVTLFSAFVVIPLAGIACLALA